MPWFCLHMVIFHRYMIHYKIACVQSHHCGPFDQLMYYRQLAISSYSNPEVNGLKTNWIQFTRAFTQYLYSALSERLEIILKSTHMGTILYTNMVSILTLSQKYFLRTSQEICGCFALLFFCSCTSGMGGLFNSFRVTSTTLLLI